jgi:hypothetical protein
MNEKIISDVLKEVLEVQQNQSKEIEFLTKVVEINNNEIKDFQNMLGQLKIQVPQLDTKPIADSINLGIDHIRKIVASQPKEVLHEKRILFYPEGNGENFIKFLFTRLLWVLCICGIVWVFVKVGGPYFVENSENGRYKDAYLWVYVNASPKAKGILLFNLEEMKNDSIRESRSDIIKSTRKRLSK